MESPALSIKLYDLFRKDLNLPESKAQEAVQIINETVKEQNAGKQEHTVELFHKDMQSLKEYIDLKFNETDKRFASKEDLANTKADVIKWMFIFWIGQIAATLAIVFLKK